MARSTAGRSIIIVIQTRKTPERVPMEFGLTCQYFLLRSGDDFAIQYQGEDANKNFPAEMEGSTLSIVTLNCR